MGKLQKRRGERALESARGALGQARGTLSRRLDDIDLDAARKRGARLAGSVRSDLGRRMRPSRRRVSPWGVIGFTSLVVLGAAAVSVGYVVYDRERREAARKRLDGMQAKARERYAELTGGRTAAESDLQERVTLAIAEGGGLPEGLEVVVEGRTVYLRGAVADPSLADAAAERAHGVRGVVAVVNLTTSAARDQAMQSR